jgi:hypothetical protein
MTAPISLADEELRVVMTAASPLPPHARDSFLREVAARLQDVPKAQLGLGLVSRNAREVQRTHVDAPVRIAPPPGTGREIKPLL